MSRLVLGPWESLWIVAVVACLRDDLDAAYKALCRIGMHPWNAHELIVAENFRTGRAP